MTALTSESRVCKFETGAQNIIRRFIVATGKIIYKGAMVSLDNAGNAVPASDEANISGVIGIASISAGSGETVYTETGLFALANKDCTVALSTDKIVLVADDNTVSKATTNSVTAGIFRFIDEEGFAVVEIGNIPA